MTAPALPAAPLKHTPGPWRVLHKTGVFPADSDCYAVGTAEQHRKEAAANAALMAAAPDLLAALRKLVEDNARVSSEDCYHYADLMMDSVAWDIAAAAIAKATGQEPAA